MSACKDQNTIDYEMSAEKLHQGVLTKHMTEKVNIEVAESDSETKVFTACNNPFDGIESQETGQRT